MARPRRYRGADTARRMARIGALSLAHLQYGAISFTGTGAMSATGAVKMAAPATFTGAGSMSATGRLAKAIATATFTGAGSITITLPIPLIHVRPSALDLLLLDAISRRQETVRFDLLDAANQFKGVLTIDKNSPPTISNDGNRRIRRQLSEFDISPADENDIETISDRVRPVWILGEGGEGYEFPLGVFLWADASRVIRSYGTTLKSTLHDQCLIIDQPLLQSVSYGEGQSIQAALVEQASLAGIVDLSIDDTAAVVGASIGWVAGRDSRLKVLESLCALAGFLPPYFDNSGKLVCRSAPDLSVAETDLVYGPGTRVIDESVIASDDLLSAPNLYLVIDTSAKDQPLFGTFQIPASAPHSFAHRGWYIPKVIELQGLEDQIAADRAAEAAYATDSATFTWLSFDSTPDPRHDTFDVIAFGDTRYREQSWRLPCEAGAAMNHDVRGIYQEASV